MKALQVAERELEQQRKQHHVAMDKLLLQTQSLEQALKTERHVVTEERWVQRIIIFREICVTKVMHYKSVVMLSHCI